MRVLAAKSAAISLLLLLLTLIYGAKAIVHSSWNQWGHDSHVSWRSNHKSMSQHESSGWTRTFERCRFHVNVDQFVIDETHLIIPILCVDGKEESKYSSQLHYLSLHDGELLKHVNLGQQELFGNPLLIDDHHTHDYVIGGFLKMNNNEESSSLPSLTSTPPSGLLATDRSTGERVWSYFPDSQNKHPIIQSALASNNTLVLQSETDHTIFAVVYGSNQRRWSKPWSESTSFTIDQDGFIYVMSKQTIEKLNPMDGDTMVKALLPEGFTEFGLLSRKLSVANKGTMFMYGIAHDEQHVYLVAFSNYKQSSSLIWKAAFASIKDFHYSPPVLINTDGNRVYMITVGKEPGSRVVFAYDAQTGQPLWRSILEGKGTFCEHGMISNKDLVVAKCDDNLFVLDPGSGLLVRTISTTHYAQYRVVLDAEDNLFLCGLTNTSNSESIQCLRRQLVD